MQHTWFFIWTRVSFHSSTCQPVNLSIQWKGFGSDSRLRTSGMLWVSSSRAPENETQQHVTLASTSNQNHGVLEQWNLWQNQDFEKLTVSIQPLIQWPHHLGAAEAFEAVSHIVMVPTSSSDLYYPANNKYFQVIDTEWVNHMMVTLKLCVALC